MGESGWDKGRKEQRKDIWQNWIPDGKGWRKANGVLAFLLNYSCFFLWEEKEVALLGCCKSKQTIKHHHNDSPLITFQLVTKMRLQSGRIKMHSFIHERIFCTRCFVRGLLKKKEPNVLILKIDACNLWVKNTMCIKLIMFHYSLITESLF